MQGVFWSTYKYFSIPLNKGDKNYGAKNRDIFFFLQKTWYFLNSLLELSKYLSCTVK